VSVGPASIARACDPGVDTDMWFPFPLARFSHVA
jgi:hypothetical protein